MWEPKEKVFLHIQNNSPTKPTKIYFTIYNKFWNGFLKKINSVIVDLYTFQAWGDEETVLGWSIIIITEQFLKKLSFSNKTSQEFKW